MTNFERIKAMSVEEMAQYIVRIRVQDCVYPNEICYGRLCHECLCEWLESEVQDGDQQ